MNCTIYRNIAVALRTTRVKVVVCTATAAAAATASLTATAAATITCSSVAACVLANNISTNLRGPAITGLSRSGDGVQGKTYLASTSPSNAKSGIAGFDLSSSGTYDSGVFGYSTAGSGVHGSTRDGSGVLAVATGAAGIGVSVTSRYSGLHAVVNGDDSTGLQAEVNGSSSVGARFRSASTNSSDIALYADATQSGDAVVAYGRFTGVHASANADNGVGIFGSTFGAHGFGVFADAEGPATTAIPLFVETSISDTLIDAQTCRNATCTNLLTLDHNGNLDVYGHITSTSPAMFSTRRADGKRVMAFAPREAAATIEDVGEAQLTAGAAAVPLAADFVQIIDPTRPYYVFVTPEGENRGVYVTQKTSRGFIIRESGGARSTMPVQYRIVATPRDVVPSRLPSEESLLRKLPQPLRHSTHVPAAQRAAFHVVRKP